MRPSARRRRLLVRAGVLALLAVGATGCDASGVKFGFPEPITPQGRRVLGMWQGTYWADIGVGVLVYALILWACFRHRKRGDELPKQVHYNLPIEVLYTVIPFVMVAVAFYFTAKDETYINKLSANPNVTVGVVGFQWAWQFNYPSENLRVTGRPGQYPTLVLPVNQTIQFIETSPDVVHAFWVPEFLFKRDVVPGRVNKFEITIQKTGTFRGECTELCGVYHSRMLFTLKAVSQSDYRRFLAGAKAQAQAGTSDIYTTINQPTPSGSSS